MSTLEQMLSLLPEPVQVPADGREYELIIHLPEATRSGLSVQEKARAVVLHHALQQDAAEARGSAVTDVALPDDVANRSDFNFLAAHLGVDPAGAVLALARMLADGDAQVELKPLT